MKRLSPPALLLTFSLCITASASAQVIDLGNPTARQIASGVQANARAGSSLDVGDIDGDINNRDLVVRSPNWSSNRGEVRVVFGWLRTPGDFSLSVADAVLTGTAAGDRFGSSTATGFVLTTELNPDLRTCPAGRTTCSRDLVVGAPGASGGKGEVYVFAGPFLQGDVKTPGAAAFRIIGAAGDQLGSAVETADLNGDGYREVIASAPGTNRVYVLDLRAPGGTVRDLSVVSATSTIAGPAASAFGSVLATGDVSDDGRFDLAISATLVNSGAGQVYVVKGRTGALPASMTLPANADMVFSGGDAGDHAGGALWISDVDGDLKRDLIVAAPDGDGPANARPDAGDAYVVFGSAALAGTIAPNVTIYGAAAGNRTGADLSTGDITRDNPDDIALLAPGGSGGRGQIDVVYGRSRASFPTVIDLATTVDRRIVGDAAAGAPIESVLVWEVTPDGAEDLVAGVPGAATSAGAQAGRLYFTLSPTLTVSPTSISIAVLENAGGSAVVNVLNNTLVPVSFAIADDQPWITLTPGTSTTTAGAAGSFTVTTAASLPVGVHSGTVTVTSNSPNLESLINIPVTVTVAGVRMAVDAPAEGATVKQPFNLSGWAIDLGSASGTGVDLIHVYVVPPGGNPIFIGAASYGGARPDIGSLFGSRFTNSGYSLAVKGVAGGAYELRVFAHSTVTGAFTGVATRSVTIQDSAVMSIDTPSEGQFVPTSFTIAGWAADLAATSGVGVDTVHIYANPAAGAQVFLGAATPSTARPDVGSAFGSQFTNSGYSLNVTSLPPGNYTLIAFAHSTVANAFTINKTVAITVFAGGTPNPGPNARINLNRKALYFGARTGTSARTGPQQLTIDNIDGPMAWSVTSNQPWVVVSPPAGVGTQSVSISIASGATASGSATLTITAQGAKNSPLTIPVTFTMHAGPPPPSGVFETPLNNSSGVTGAIPVTGWAVHDLQIADVKIWRDPVAGEPGGARVFIGNATMVDGARPDIESTFAKPFNYAGGWGYMLLTNMLPNQGNGTFTLYAIATAVDGSSTVLGARTIVCDNANATLPFGSIDTPAQGGSASGSAFVNFGWALTPQPGMIPTDGSTLRVYVDGAPLGQPSYNNFRSDIATLFPGLKNSNGAVGVFQLNTTAMTNGVHTIAWTVTDNLGRSAGIGSRFFTVLNGAGGSVMTERGAGPVASPGLDLGKPESSLLTAVAETGPALVRQGADMTSASVRPDADGVRQIASRELDRIEIELGPAFRGEYSGYLIVDGQLRALPTGSTLDRTSGTFYWQPGVGFIGAYDLVFIRTAGALRSQTRLRVTIAPHQTKVGDDKPRP